MGELVDPTDFNKIFLSKQIKFYNCHAFTDNYRGKNIKRSAQKEISDVESLKFKEALTGNADGNLEPSLNKKSYILIKEGAETRQGKPKSKKLKEHMYCEHRGKELTVKQYRNKYCSLKCSHEANGSKRPDVFTLLSDFNSLKSFVKIGKKYGVTDNAVRKWCSLYGILDKVKE